jgi:hypothetical protein
MFRGSLTVAALIASVTAVSAQNYTIRRFGDMTSVDGPNGYHGELFSPFGRNGPSTYSDNSRSINRPPPNPFPGNPYAVDPRRLYPYCRGYNC